MDLHLDPVGGIAGDMMIAALLDLFPDLEPILHAALLACPPLAGVSARLESHGDGVLTGRRFIVEAGHRHHHGHDHDHGHIAWREIRAMLESAPLDAETRRHALAIFGHLAEAEAAIHGVDVDAVQFHEVGAWDSIADIVGAAALIAALGVKRWTLAALPLGGGRVRTSHGPLPVPAPATARLLEGFAVIDDGIPGERVTPTGAAILRHLAPTPAVTGEPRRLGGAGIGFGTRRLPGLSNCLRILRFDPLPALGDSRDQVAVLEFEIDDMSGEDLAHGLDHLRAHPAVRDVVQAPGFGKKGRLVAQIRVLADPAALEAVADLCFRETTTIGLRHAVVARRLLPRAIGTAAVDGRTVALKTVDRPGGTTVKAEADAVAAIPGHAARTSLRRRTEEPR
jgi:uncharacterized protein (TIGR00299 family) protein